MHWRRCLGTGLLLALLVSCTAAGESRPPGQNPSAPAADAAPIASLPGQPPQAPQKVIFALPSAAGSFLAHQLAQQKGFFREEGLDVELMVTRSNLIAVGLTAGEIDYSGSFGPSVRHALTGMPIRPIAATTRASRQMMSTPRIQSLEQLRGQTVAVGAIGDGPHSAGVVAFEHYGIDPQEVTWISAGGTMERILAVQQGGAQAVILATIDMPLATSMGLVPLLNLSEIAPFPESGVTTSQQKLETDRDQVKRLLRAIVRGLQYLKNDREGTLPILMTYLGLSREAAEQTYDATVTTFIDDGLPSERSMRFAIDADRKQLGITAEVPINRVADFGPLCEVLAEMRLTPESGCLR